jgi:hypothetical protein
MSPTVAKPGSKKMTRLIRKTVLLTTAACMTVAAGAYEIPTHVTFCEVALNRSVLSTDPNFWADINMPLGLGTTYPASTGGVRLGSSLVPYGSTQEDEEFQTIVFNHFFDPQFNNFTGRGMDAFSLTGNASPNWAIEDLGEVRDIRTNREQIFSVRHLQQYFYAALTSATVADRQTFMGRTLESLGHAIHHIQDMAQPQHVRNDQHVHPLPFVPGPDINPEWAFYERFSQDHLTPAVVLSLVNGANYPIPSFPSSRQFWHTQGATTARYVGMAEFTSNNFVSWGKNFQTQMAWNQPIPVEAGSDMPNPDTANVDGTHKNVQSRSVSVTLPNFSQRTGSMDFAIGKVYDGNTGVIVADQKLAAVSVTSGLVGPGAVSGPLAVFVENSGVYEDQYRFLVPRAVAFSTGLINHQFRGRLNVQRSGNSSSWTVTNLSGTPTGGTAMQQQAINGILTLYYDDASNVRRQIPGSAATTVNLSYGQSITIAASEPPAGTRKVIAAFRGRIGAEGDASGAGFFVSAGKAIDFAPPTIPCGAPFSAAGGIEGAEQYMDLGSAAGTVQGEFEAYYITDSMVVRRTNSSGQLLFTTNGFVRGYQTFDIAHAGSTDPALNRIWIKITGSESGTAWTSTIGCPGQAIGNADRVLKRVNIGFQQNGNNLGCPSGHYNIILDGLHVGTLPWGQFGGASLGGIQTTQGSNHNLRLVKVTTNNGSPYTVGCALPVTMMSLPNFTTINVNAYIGNGGSISIQ